MASTPRQLKNFSRILINEVLGRDLWEEEFLGDRRRAPFARRIENPKFIEELINDLEISGVQSDQIEEATEIMIERAFENSDFGAERTASDIALALEGRAGLRKETTFGGGRVEFPIPGRVESAKTISDESEIRKVFLPEEGGSLLSGQLTQKEFERRISRDLN